MIGVCDRAVPGAILIIKGTELAATYVLQVEGEIQGSSYEDESPEDDQKGRLYFSFVC